MGVKKSYKFPPDKTQRKRPRYRHKRWDKSLTGTPCPVCGGTGQLGPSPCPQRMTITHGYPICINGHLYFTDQDLAQWDALKLVYK